METERFVGTDYSFLSCGLCKNTHWQCIWGKLELEPPETITVREIVTLHQEQWWFFSGKIGPGCHLQLKIVKMTVGLEKISSLVRLSGKTGANKAR